MKLKKILVPIDFSTASDSALHFAGSLARESGAEILLVHVEETPLAYGAGEFYVGAADVSDTEELAKKLAAIVPQGDVRCTHRLLAGEAAGAIVDLAREAHADLIVMGTHGRTGLMRLLMGSTAESVVRSAPCPVLTLREANETPVVAE